MTNSVVIVGAGHAAGQLVVSLAQEGFRGPITMIGDEPYLPYQRPPLSKKFLAGEIDLERLYVRPADFFERAGARLLLNTHATSIDRARRAITIASGSALAYDKLVLATGSRPRKLTLPGADREGVLYLRTIDDVRAIQSRFASGRRLVIIGGGYIGLELAAVAAQQGLAVTVLESAPRLMARGVGPIVSAFYERLHRSHGVVIVTSTGVLGFDGGSRVERVTGSEGSYPADLVVVGVGALPNTELAEAAGLEIDNGIVVDEFCRTSDPTIYAVGDCTNHPNALLGRRLRLESVHNAVEQAKTAAAALCGRSLPYAQVPWFWSDQFDVKLQIAGLTTGEEETVVRGDPDHGHSFAVFYLKNRMLVAVEAVNRAPEFMMSKLLIADKVRLDPARLSDERIAMKEVRG